MTTPAERAFAYFPLGRVRDDILMELRLGLALLVNPETGALFTADEVAQATQQGSIFWIEANAIDLMGMAQQSRALVVADQVRLDRANTVWLRGYHGSLWGTAPLGASGGSGSVTAPATVGTVFIGSTTPADPTATTFRDPAGLRYQVLTTVVTPGSGVAPLTLLAIDTGPATNLLAGTQLTLDANPPLGASPTGIVVVADFTGGLDAEGDADYQSRIRADVRHKQAAGNNAQMRAWARESSNAIADGFVYACAMHAGSVLVCITQKRAGAVGPNALVANAGALAAARGYLTPPGSPVVPERVFMLVVTFVPQPVDTIVQFTQPKGSSSGWADVTPWPGITSTIADILTVTDQQHFRMHSDTTLPGGASSLSGSNAPKLMVWNPSTSRFEALIVTSVTVVGGGLYDVVLTAAPARTLVVGDYISPDMARRAVLAAAVETYFDGLGPGEVVNLTTDSRADRAARHPDPSEESPSRAGQAITTAITDALGATLADISLGAMSSTTPALPADVSTGPSKMTLGRFAVYELP